MKFSEMPYKRVTWEEIRETMQGHIQAFTQAEDGEGQYPSLPGGYGGYGSF